MGRLRNHGENAVIRVPAHLSRFGGDRRYGDHLRHETGRAIRRGWRYRRGLNDDQRDGRRCGRLQSEGRRRHADGGGGLKSLKKKKKKKTPLGKKGKKKKKKKKKS